MAGAGRKNLAELDSALRTRLLRLDEPVDRSDWEAIVERSRRVVRRSRYRSLAVVASGAAVLSLAFALGLGLLSSGAGQPRRGAAPLRLALHLSGGSGLVLYSVANRTRFLDNPSESAAPVTASLVRSLSGGPFRVQPAVLRRATATRHVAGALMPGDEALVSFRLFTTAALGKTAGSAVLRCQYGFATSAYCTGAVDLDNGLRLTAAGTLDTGAHEFDLVVTSDYGRAV